MIAANALIVEVARYITDYDSTDAAHQHVEWSKSDLLSYMRIAVTSLALTMPKKFAKQITVPLIGVSPVQLPTQCEEYLGTVAFIDATGKRHVDIREQPTDSTVYVMRRPVCAAPTAGQVTVPVVQRSSSNALALELSPVPAGGQIIVDCMCVPEILSAESDIKVPASYSPVLFHWMVSLAFGTDIESAAMRAISETHWQRGVDLLLIAAPQAKAPARAGVPQ